MVAFYFTFFPSHPPTYGTPTPPSVCVVFFGFHCVCLRRGREREIGEGGVTGPIYVCVWHLCKRCHKNFRRTVAKTHHQLQQQQQEEEQQQLGQRVVTKIIKGSSNSLALSNRLLYTARILLSHPLPQSNPFPSTPPSPIVLT